MKTEKTPESQRFRDPTRYDVIVIGAGHAGCEAARASARMGMKTLLLTISIDQIAHMSCNPAIGGIAKGHLVKEIDALGGIMALAIDSTGIQFRRLNTKKGPAVRSSRAQADMYAYKDWIRENLESQEHLHIKQGLAEGFLLEEGNGARKIGGIFTQAGEEYIASAVVLASGTFLGGVVHLGETKYHAGRSGEPPANNLSTALAKLGLRMGRLMTCTTPRLDAKTIDFDKMQPQPGDAVPRPFSFRTEKIDRPQINCWITRTDTLTQAVIQENLHRSPMISGVMRGIPPRYCPSIEDKVRHFPERTNHQLFMEPEGARTREIYANGLFTGLPVDIQIQMLQTITGLEEVQIMRPGYAIEYDFVHPTQLGPDLMLRAVPGLFLAGQINGTSGYEEAAAQGILAGINAALTTRGEPPLTLRRDEAYIGVLVDDLVTKGVTEPYRVFTSRAEHRLLLREDNADLRLMEKGHKVGLISDDEIHQLREKDRLVREGLTELEKHRVMIDLTRGPKRGVSLHSALCRSDVFYEDLTRLDPGFVPVQREDVAEQIEIQAKYRGYIARQEAMVEKFRRLDSMIIPEDLDYYALRALSREIKDRLSEVRPGNLGQASRIPGVTPAAVSALMIYLKKGAERGKGKV